MAKQTRTTKQGRSIANPNQMTGRTPSTPEPPVTSNRSERVLAFMVAGVFAVSLLCMIIMIIAWLTIKQIPGTGVWPLITVLPEIGLPIGMVLVLALLALNWSRKARANRNETR